MNIFKNLSFLSILYVCTLTSCVVVTDADGKSSNICTSSSVVGNGNITSQPRTIPPNISSVIAKTGIRVHISINPQTPAQLRIQAESNVFEKIHTDVSGNQIQLFASDLCTHQPIDIFLTLPQIKQVDSSSAAQIDIQGNSQLETISASSGSQVTVTEKNQLHQVKATSGSHIQVSSIQSSSVDIHANSGAEITLQGQTQTIEVSASSGAQVNAKSLQAIIGNVQASSGAQVNICATQTKSSNASSGAQVINRC